MGVLERSGSARTVSELLGDLDEQLQRGEAGDLVPVATGFAPLDQVLGGGLHAGALHVIGGAPGVGKTIMILQWARELARAGQPVIYVCYEHEEAELLLRLVTMELADEPEETARKLRTEIITSAAGARRGLLEILRASEVGARIEERLSEYADRLVLVRASGARTGLEHLYSFVVDSGLERPALFVDYLQKVPVWPEQTTEAEKVTRVTEGLKDLALTERIIVVAIVAVEMAGLKERRLRMHDFRGSSALVFESDVALVMNDKVNAVSKVHLAYDALKSRTFHDWVVVSVEKNRNGPNGLDVEFRKDFAHFRFNPVGGFVSERLLDERLETE